MCLINVFPHYRMGSFGTYIGVSDTKWCHYSLYGYVSYFLSAWISRRSLTASVSGMVAS